MKEEEYMRVGTTLYKVVNQPCASGGYEKRRVIWNNSTLRQDYGKNYLATVPKYDGFCTVPDHLNYRKEIDGFLNLYEPIEHTPQIGDFPNIRSLVLHIFGEQYNLGLDYLQLLFLQPLQKLPILLLVSEERNTGKSTFLNFLKAVFGDNVTFNTNEDFRSQFNSDWAGKLLIVVDEVLPQGGQRAVEEPEHHFQLQGGGQRERPHGNSLLRQVRIVFKQRVPACNHRRRGNTILGKEDKSAAER